MLRVKIEKIPDHIGTQVLMGDGEKTKETAFAKEIDSETIEFLEIAINKLLEEFSN